MERSYYQDHALTVARHPSETDERMLVRIMAFALNADERMAFGKGLSSDDEPALWSKDLTGNIEHWIDVGQPQERWLRKACGQARQVSLYLYGGRTADQWWSQNRDALVALENLRVVNLTYPSTQALTELVSRSMALQVTVQEGVMWLTDGTRDLESGLQTLKTWPE